MDNLWVHCSTYYNGLIILLIKLKTLSKTLAWIIVHLHLEIEKRINIWDSVSEWDWNGTEWVKGFKDDSKIGPGGITERVGNDNSRFEHFKFELPMAFATEKEPVGISCRSIWKCEAQLRVMG